MRVQSEQGIVTTADDARHGFEDGDYVRFLEVRGLDALNAAPPRKLKALSIFLPSFYPPL